mmetsp:Transcript_8655/g.14670  ORF Transcript_8655/g.14670 Transcript_8655/m.14670 type:complete len:194 (+) Transcript_8655:3-584(+)
MESQQEKRDNPGSLLNSMASSRADLSFKRKKKEQYELYNVNLLKNSVFKYSNEQSTDVANLQKSYWHRRYLKSTTLDTGNLKAKVHDDSGASSSNSDLSFDFEKKAQAKSSKVDRAGSEMSETQMSKSVNFQSNLDYMDGDVTITDQYGLIRGRFIQTHENSGLRSFRASNYAKSFALDERDQELDFNILGGG